MRKNSVIILLNVYFVVSLLFFFFGRYNWEIPSNFKLLIVSVLFYMFLNLGYFTFLKKYGTNKTKDSRSYHVNFITCISGIALIFFQILWVLTVNGSFSFSNIFDSLNQNYYNRLDFTTDSPVFLMQIRTLLWGLTLFAYPVGFYFWKDLKKISKFILLTTLFVDVISSLNMGVSKNIGDIILIFILIQSLKYIKNPNKINYRIIFRIVIILVLFLAVFSQIQFARDNTISLSYNPYASFSTIRKNTFYDFFIKNELLIVTIDRLGAYFSHAYTGLAFSLEVGFQGVNPIGFSRALMEYFNQYVGVDLSYNTYPKYIENVYGWPNGIYWSTAFSWFASTISFYGVPILMFIFGKLASKLQFEVVYENNLVSLVILSQLFIQLIYLPANAQLFQSRASLFGTLLLFVLYFIRNKKVRLKW